MQDRMGWASLLCLDFFFFSILIHLFILLHQVLVTACGIQFPEQRSNLHPLCSEHGVLATGPLGKSPGVVRKQFNRERKEGKSESMRSYWERRLCIQSTRIKVLKHARSCQRHNSKPNRGFSQTAFILVGDRQLQDSLKMERESLHPKIGEGRFI